MDYEALRQDDSELRRYLAQLAAVDLSTLGVRPSPRGTVGQRIMIHESPNEDGTPSPRTNKLSADSFLLQKKNRTSDVKSGMAPVFAVSTRCVLFSRAQAADRKALFINAYNAFAVAMVLDHPASSTTLHSSIKDISRLVVEPVWKMPAGCALCAPPSKASRR